jgi:hypothetical protein
MGAQYRLSVSAIRLGVSQPADRESNGVAQRKTNFKQKTKENPNQMFAK